MGELIAWLAFGVGMFCAGTIVAEVFGAWWSSPRGPSRRERRDMRINDAIERAAQAEKDRRWWAGDRDVDGSGEGAGPMGSDAKKGGAR